MSRKWVARRLASRWRGISGTSPGGGQGVVRGTRPGRCETRSDPMARRWIPLAPHPGTPGPPGTSLWARWTWSERDGLLVDYRLAAPRRALIIPPRAAPARVDGLWRHTCCEAFIGARRETGYREFNFSPSGQWALYAFSKYRAPLAPPQVAEPAEAPSCHCERRRHQWLLRARVPAELLPAVAAGRDWELGLMAVVADAAGRLSYWALRHPAPAPDFHHPEGRLPARA